MRIVPNLEAKRSRYRKVFSNFVLIALTVIFIVNITLNARRIFKDNLYRKKTRFVAESKVFDNIYRKKVPLKDGTPKVISPKETTSSFKSPKFTPEKDTGKQEEKHRRLPVNQWSSPQRSAPVELAINPSKADDMNLLEDKYYEGKGKSDKSNDGVGSEHSLNAEIVAGNQSETIRRYLKKKPMKYLFKFENVTIDSLTKQHEDPEGMKRSLLLLQDVYITRYVRWHSETLRKVRRGDIRAKQVRVLLFQGKEGIGDRIRGIIHAYFLAVLSERLLLIDWEMPFPLDSALSTTFTHDKKHFRMGTENDYYLLRGIKGHAQRTDISQVLTHRKWVMMRRETEPDLNFMLNNLAHYYPNITALRRTANLVPQPTQEDFYPLIFRALFKATPALRARVVHFLRYNGLDSPFVGIHLRLGWDTAEADSNKRFATDMGLEEIANCTSEIALQMARAKGITPPLFFLATDTSEVRNEMRKAILRKTNGVGKVFFGSWKIEHVRHLLPQLEEDFDMFLNMFADMLLLSQADSLVSIPSGFPKISRWMGSIHSHYKFKCVLQE